MIKFDVVNFSERHSEEVISSFDAQYTSGLECPTYASAVIAPTRNAPAIIAPETIAPFSG